MSVVANGVPRDDGQGILIAPAAAAEIAVAAAPGRTRSRARSQVRVRAGEPPSESEASASLPISELGGPVAVLPAWARSSTTVPRRGVFCTQARPFPRSDSVWKRKVRSRGFQEASTRPLVRRSWHGSSREPPVTTGDQRVEPSGIEPLTSCVQSRQNHARPQRYLGL